MRSLSAFLAAALAFWSAQLAARADPAMQARVTALAVPFVPNAGQWDSRAAFAAQLFAGTLFVTHDGRIVYRLPGRERSDSAAVSASTRRHPARDRRAERTAGWVLSETLVDAVGEPVAGHPRGDSSTSERVAFAIGSDRARHRDGLATYERVDLGEVYARVNLQLRATGRNVEKIFTVAPGGDPGQIRVRLDGASPIETTKKGELIAQTGLGPVTFTAPVAYQPDSRGGRMEIEVRYVVHDAVRGIYGFDVGAYDASVPLVVDPLLQSTYAGGTASDGVEAMAIHPVSGEIYVAGITNSVDIPGTTGAEYDELAGQQDTFVTRFNAALTQRLQSIYVGGATAGDFPRGMAIHPLTGDVYVAGETFSTDFPDVAGAEQTTKSGNEDGYVVRLNAALTTLLQSTYLGGDQIDGVNDIAIHPLTGEIYVTGFTSSTNFPALTGAEVLTGTGFVTRLTSDLTVRLQSTLLGDATPVALRIHPQNGDVYVAGYAYGMTLTKSTGTDQPANNGAPDGFVARLAPSLTTFVRSTFLGGTGQDFLMAMDIHPVTGEIFVAGHTESTDLPGTAGAEQTGHGGGTRDGFVARFDPQLISRLQSTYLGGMQYDQVSSVAIHRATGDVYVAGSTGGNFPNVAGGEQPNLAGGTDGFVTRLNAALTARIQSTYLGTTSSELINSMAIHPVSGDVYVAGATGGSSFPKVTGSAQPTSGGIDDGFVSRYSFDLRAGDTVPDGFAIAPKLNVAPASLQLSAPVQLKGLFGGVPISVYGGNFAEYCVSSSGAGCPCDIVSMRKTASTINDSQYVCVRQVAPASTPAQAIATLLVGGDLANFVVTTGTQIGGACTLDVDGNSQVDALTDGLMLIRALFGLTGTAVTNNAVGGGAIRSTWAQIRAHLNGNCGANFAQ